MTTPRKLAIEVLNKIFNKRINAKDAIDELSVALERRDRAFVMEIVYGVLRHRDYIDYMLKGFLMKPSGISLSTLNNLRTAVYQILYMNVPHWAAVDEAVKIERNNKKPLVNAVLRNFLRNKDKIELPKIDTAQYIAIKTSHPEWLIKRWIERFGFSGAFSLAEANNKRPPVTLRVESPERRGEVLRTFSERGINASPTKYSPSGIILDEFFPSLEKEIFNQRLFIQDEASQLVTYLLNPHSGERILDACAAPGGKTTHIAQLMRDDGVVVAVESEPKRIISIIENIERLGIRSIKIINSDIRDIKNIGFFDKILVDAPCSAIGVIRRNPDIKYRRKRSDLLKYKEKQLDILYASSRFLKNGGTMVYSVCSTESDEGEDVIMKFLKNNKGFITIEGDYDFFQEFKEKHNKMTFYRTFPHIHNMDGFFMARLMRIEE